MLSFYDQVECRYSVQRILHAHKRANIQKKVHINWQNTGICIQIKGRIFSMIINLREPIPIYVILDGHTYTIKWTSIYTDDVLLQTILL